MIFIECQNIAKYVTIKRKRKCAAGTHIDKLTTTESSHNQRILNFYLFFFTYSK